MSKRRHRGSNEGSIYERADGRWEAKVNLGYRNGKRKRASFYGATRAEVATQLTKALRDLGQGLPIAPERQKLAAFLARWLEEAVKPSVRVSTFEQYHQHVKLYLAPALGHIELARLTADHVQSLVNRQLKRGLSPRTAQLTLVTLKRALKQAERWGLVVRNVARLVDAPRVTLHKAQPLGPDQARHLLEVARETEYGALYTVLLLCGLRLGEALGLGWQHVDFDAQTIAIERALARVGRVSGNSRLTMQETKTAQARRVLHAPEIVIRALHEHRARQLRHAGPDWHDLGLVFATRRGSPHEQSNIHRDYKRLLATAGLPASVRIHDLRHSSASLLLNLGIPLKTIQAILGHSSIKVTSDIYAHLAPQMQRDAANQLDELFAEN